MDIGKLNRQVEVLRFFKDRDEYGGEVGEWRSVGNVWASIHLVSGTEYLNAQQVTAEHTTVITIRYNPRIDVLHRIRYGKKVFEIIAVHDEDAAHKETVLNCKEKVNGELQRETEESESGGGGSGQTCPKYKGDG